MDIKSNYSYALRLMKFQKQKYPVALAVRNKCSNESLREPALLSYDNRILNFSDCLMDEIDLDRFRPVFLNSGMSTWVLLVAIFTAFVIVSSNFF